MQRELMIRFEDPTGNLLLKISFIDLSLLKYEMSQLLPQCVRISMFHFLNSLIALCVCKGSLSGTENFKKRKFNIQFQCFLKTLISACIFSELLPGMDFSDVFYVVL